jgi:hypothetical protein
MASFLDYRRSVPGKKSGSVGRPTDPDFFARNRSSPIFFAGPDLDPDLDCDHGLGKSSPRRTCRTRWGQPTNRLSSRPTAGMTDQPSSVAAERRRQRGGVSGSAEAVAAAAMTTIKTKTAAAARQQGSSGKQRGSRVAGIARRWR